LPAYSIEEGFKETSSELEGHEKFAEFGKINPVFIKDYFDGFKP